MESTLADLEDARTGQGPQVSVVIPTRNRLGMLAQTLHTVLAQDVELEVVVVDEASSDATPDWLARHPDPRVRTVRHESPRGLSEARNAGIAASTGSWLAFVDDDDLWLPTKLIDQLAAAEHEGALWAFGGAITFSAGPRLLQGPRPLSAETVRNLLHANAVPGGGSNAIVARQALAEVGGFDPSVNIVADWDMWIRLSQISEPAVVPHTVMAYRIHGSNMSNNVEEMLDAIDALDARYRHLRGGPLDWLSLHQWLWLLTMRSGDRSSARRIALRGLRMGQPNASRQLIRTFVPLRLRDPITDPAEATGALDRIRPRRVIEWPPQSESWLRQALAVTP